MAQFLFILTATVCITGLIAQPFFPRDLGSPRDYDSLSRPHRRRPQRFDPRDRRDQRRPLDQLDPFDIPLRDGPSRHRSPGYDIRRDVEPWRDRSSGARRSMRDRFPPGNDLRRRFDDIPTPIVDRIQSRRFSDRRRRPQERGDIMPPRESIIREEWPSSDRAPRDRRPGFRDTRGRLEPRIPDRRLSETRITMRGRNPNGRPLEPRTAIDARDPHRRLQTAINARNPDWTLPESRTAINARNPHGRLRETNRALHARNPDWSPHETHNEIQARDPFDYNSHLPNSHDVMGLLDTFDRGSQRNSRLEARRGPISRSNSNREMPYQLERSDPQGNILYDQRRITNPPTFSSRQSHRNQLVVNENGWLDTQVTSSGVPDQYITVGRQSDGSQRRTNGGRAVVTNNIHPPSVIRMNQNRPVFDRTQPNQLPFFINADGEIEHRSSMEQTGPAKRGHPETHKLSSVVEMKNALASSMNEHSLTDLINGEISFAEHKQEAGQDVTVKERSDVTKSTLNTTPTTPSKPSKETHTKEPIVNLSPFEKTSKSNSVNASSQTNTTVDKGTTKGHEHLLSDILGIGSPTTGGKTGTPNFEIVFLDLNASSVSNAGSSILSKDSPGLIAAIKKALNTGNEPAKSEPKTASPELPRKAESHVTKSVPPADSHKMTPLKDVSNKHNVLNGTPLPSPPVYVPGQGVQTPNNGGQGLHASHNALHGAPVLQGQRRSSLLGGSSMQDMLFHSMLMENLF